MERSLKIVLIKGKKGERGHLEGRTGHLMAKSPKIHIIYGNDHRKRVKLLHTTICKVSLQSYIYKGDGPLTYALFQSFDKFE